MRRTWRRLKPGVSGPGVPYDAGCDVADFDLDNDVDQADFGRMQRCLSGEDMLPDANCMN